MKLGRASLYIWPGVSPPRARLGWIRIVSVQCSHFTVPSISTKVLLARPQLRQFQVRRTYFMTYPLSRRRPATGGPRGGQRSPSGDRRTTDYHACRGHRKAGLPPFIPAGSSRTRRRRGDSAVRPSRLGPAPPPSLVQDRQEVHAEGLSGAIARHVLDQQGPNQRRPACVLQTKLAGCGLAGSPEREKRND